MSSQILPILEFDSADPQHMGYQHGEIYREKIQELCEIRLERMCAISHFSKPKDIINLAQEYLMPLKIFDSSLFLELESIAQASNTSLEKLVVLNNYTDMRDIKPDFKKSNLNLPDAEDCSIIFSPNNPRPILGQTWDIHASAMPYVLLLKFQDSLVFSVMGCLGMTGLNKFSLGVAINNLNSHEGQIGVMWPAIIRKILQKKSVLESQDIILNAKIGSGRHYALCDKTNFLGLEICVQKHKIITQNINKIYFHTNHCLDPELEKLNFIRPGSNTQERYDYLQENLPKQDLSNPASVFLALAGVGIQAQPNYCHKTATCGTFVMDLVEQKILACQGISNKNLLKDPRIELKLKL